jgi:hypothetical protein
MALEGSPGALGFTFGISMQDYHCDVVRFGIKQP